MRVFAVVRGDIDEYRTTSIHPSSIIHHGWRIIISLRRRLSPNAFF